jgi:hypothetical protein
MAATRQADGWTLHMGVFPAGDWYGPAREQGAEEGTNHATYEEIIHAKPPYKVSHFEHFIVWTVPNEEQHWWQRRKAEWTRYSGRKHKEVQAAGKRLGRKGGQSTSAPKATAARENGKKGGRPPGS